MVIPSTVLVEGDPIQTAKNIGAKETLYRLGIVGSFLTQLLHILIPWLLYRLFSTTDKQQALLMLSLALISVPTTLFNELYKLSALNLLDSPIEMMNSLSRYAQGELVSSVFWGLWLFPLAILINKSRAFPKLITYALFLAGIGYIFGALTTILFPLSEVLKPLFEALTFGEVLFILWFVIKGLEAPVMEP